MMYSTFTVKSSKILMRKKLFAKSIMFNTVSRVGMPFLVYFVRGPLIFFYIYI